MTVASATLDNGVQVECEPVGGLRSVAVGIWVRLGGAHDPPDREGAAHMLEHMVFKGTGRRSAEEIARAIESIGGWLDAYTSREHTSYQARIASGHLDEALDVLADMIVNPRLDRNDFLVERQVILEEIAQVEDTPDDLVHEMHGRRLWSGHPYGKPILGTEESVGEMSLDCLERRHDRYRGSNLIVAAAGSLDPERFLDRVERLFRDVAPGEPSEAFVAPERVSRGIELVDRSTKQAHIVFGAAVPGRRHPDRHALAIVSQALGGGMSSRLFRTVREEMGLCYQVHSYQQFFGAAGLTGVYAGTRPETADGAVEAIRKEMSAVAAGRLSREEVATAKEQLKGGLVLSLESTASRLARLASFSLNHEPFLGADELLARIDRVGEEDVARVAAAHFDPENHLVLRLGPEALPPRAAA